MRSLRSGLDNIAFLFHMMVPHGTEMRRGQAIPFNGTLVTSMIGYSNKVDLTDALIFGGKRHIPVDYIETHFEEDKDGNVTFVLRDESSGFGSRAAGEPVRRKLRNVVHALNQGKVIVDFTDSAGIEQLCG